MLSLRKITKNYKTGEFTQTALKKVSLDFRQNEFVAILGQSGSGKTTLLNMIGGLDRYDAGDIIINGKSTKKFKENDWDAYRNNCVGFIFQNYNLITHISVLKNIELSMTLSGVNSSERKKRALEALKKVGLEKHAHKKPNQLSGGQMQRVAIARALVNNPDIILADEPTGALDSETSIQIMELIKEIAKDKLVIMVTHNPDLAKEYASRIVEMKDGEVTNDTNPVAKEEEINNFEIKKTSMGFLTALNLSFNNIKTKKGRTILTAFASSIGIIGIALILSLSNGFKIQIDKFEKDTLSAMPIIISEQTMKMDKDTMFKLQGTTDKQEKYPETKKVYPTESAMETMIHKNKITDEYIKYIEKINPDYIDGLGYTRSTSLNLINSKYEPVNTMMLNIGVLPKNLNSDTSEVIDKNYDLLYGRSPKNKNEMLLAVDSKNNIDSKLIELLGLNSDSKELTFDDILNASVKAVLNNDYYTNLGDYFTINSNLKQSYEKGIELKVVGIIRGKEDKEMLTNASSLIYTEDLVNYIVENNRNSDVVKAQLGKDYNILTGSKFDNENNTKDNALAYLGNDTVPSVIQIYPKDFDSKDAITDYLDKYNENKEEKIIYNDMAELISSLSGNIMNAITIVLIAFSAISLVVSCIMIGIITYISVLERTKEIGVLRSLGARKKDVKRVFNAETFIVGVASGLLGIGIAYLLTIPANILIYKFTNLENVARLDPIHALILITISVLLTVLGGSIPARIASKKDPVEALRTE